MANVFEIWIEAFLIITTPIAIFFEFLTIQLISIFSGIPPIAIDFVFAILTYSTLTLLGLLKKKCGELWSAIFSILYHSVLVMTILYIIWKTRLVTLLPDRVDSDSTVLFFINLMYVLLAIGIIALFYKSEKKRELQGESNRIKLLKKIIKGFIWLMFLLVTFVIAPIYEGFLLTMDTILQTWFLLAYFVVPNSMLYYHDKNDEGDSK